MTEWTVRAAGRLDEMSHGKLSLQIEIQQDGDIVVYINEDGIPIRDTSGNIARVEFCEIASGGGRSPETRRGLMEVFKGMLIDAKLRPDGIPRYPIQLAEMMKGEKL